MPVTTSYPGIYIQELPSSAHTITAAPTNIAVFIGYTHPLKTSQEIAGIPQQIFGFTDYQRAFGGYLRSTLYSGQSSSFADMATAVNQFFLNGGTEAYVVGLLPDNLPSPPTKSYGTVVFTAREVTDATFQLSISVTLNPPTVASPPASSITADVVLTYGPSLQANAGGALLPGTVTETYRRVSLTPNAADGTPDPNFIERRIGTAADHPTLGTPANFVSNLVTVAAGPTPAWPTTISAPQPEYFASLFPAAVTNIFNPNDYTAVMAEDSPLDKLAVFNLMVLPGIAANPAAPGGITVLSTALTFCERKLAFLIMDPPQSATADSSSTLAFPANPIANLVTFVPKSTNGALYFPYLQSPDPLTGSATNPITGAVNEIPPAATVAGIYAATDVARGVWKAPAGFQATTSNTTGVVTRGSMTDNRQGVLNPLGINCLRDFANIGTVVFGSRTLVTLTEQQWRYVPVRRMALFLEQSLLASLKWVVFEPNADPLWSAIRLSINAFMLGLFNQGAFQGTTPSQAFLVQCDSQTTTQADIDNGIVNIIVGFAPLLPAEFVIISIAQLAGQSPAG
jgi:phage tail sheath protein FI